MIPVWLYGGDGRALYCVYVPPPLPITVRFAGEIFTWDGRRYVRIAHSGAAHVKGAPPVAEAPPELAAKTPKE